MVEERHCHRRPQEDSEPADMDVLELTLSLSAFHVEEELKKHQKEKEDHLRRFQGEVKHRVNQHARMRKKQQMLKCYDANSLCRRSSPVCVNDDLEDCFLERPRDILAEQQDQILVASRAGKENKFHCSEGRGKVYDRILKEPSPTGPDPAFSTDFQSALVLRPGAELEKKKKQRENQYLMYRRLFMSIERDQVKEMRRQKENEKRIAKIKKGKELLSRAEEKRIHNLTILEESYSGERECEVLGELTLEDQQWKVTDEKKPKSKRVR
ncbi:coiled-coil domain-containing protein 15 isoform X2 [Ambystoma mexicanum]|uniref:coiled-coil domain-containing protein 15 isoform X2 n=1 Tax=Ambystoma mexicanum TaxID=8296 RepID=UPI0037E7B490